MTRIAVAAPNRHAVDAAARACAAGGNAVDSALAAMATAVATEPGMVTPLGGAFVSVWPAGGEPVVVDGNVEMPGRGRPAEAFGGGLRPLRIDYGGGVELFVGHGSVATPGSFAAFQEAHDRFGGLPWAEVLAPAIDVLRSGFVVGQASETYLCFVGGPIFGWDAETRRSHHRADGAPLRRGDVVRLPDLAASYEVIAREGAAALYTGSLARAIVADMDARGGLLSAEDLAAYRPVVREPYRVTLGDWHVATNPPPSVGGVMLALMLGDLATRAGQGYDDVIDVQHRVLSYRAQVHDHSRDLEADGRLVLQTAARDGLEGLREVATGADQPSTSASTVHVSVVDAEGSACAITASAGYGSGVTTPGTGLVHNNALGEIELNRLGIHALPPGTRLASNMAPSVARTADGRVLSIGSPGADRITTALMQVINQGCLHGLDLQSAIDRPRVHVSIVDGQGVVEFEEDPEVIAAVQRSPLPSRGHGERSMFFGGVGAAYRREDGVLEAAGDPRREAATGVF